jgi:hypothetical protein
MQQCELHPEVPTVLVPLCNFFECRNTGLSGAGIKVRQSGSRTLRHQTEMLDAGIPIPAASASMPMPSYAKDIKYIMSTCSPYGTVCSSQRIFLCDFLTEIHENCQKEMSIGSLCSTNVFLSLMLFR